MSKIPPKPPGFTGRAVTVIFEARNFSRLVLLEIKDGVVVKAEPVTNPDMAQITVCRAEEAIWDIVDELKGKF